MQFERKLSVEGKHPADLINWKTVPVKITGAGGKILFEMENVEVPAEWSDTATQIIASKYFRKAGVPSQTARHSRREIGDAKQPPGWLHPSQPEHNATFSSETSAKQVFHRLAGALTYHGWKMGLFKTDEKSAQIFYEELYLILAKQLAAPNSPQWFNTGLWWAYGIEGPASGQWAIDYKTGEPFQTQNAYEYPQPHACFIQPVSDDLVNPGGILDLIVREGRLFKQGSGTGTNFSTIRAEGEPLSGGGKSSGLMSFLRIGDRAAGAIKSGGVTRRAAKMVIVDADHPEIEAFIDLKAREEQKAAAMWIGSKMLNDPDLREILSENGLIPSSIEDQISEGMLAGEFGINYEGEAIQSVDGQNANYSVRVRDSFMDAVGDNANHGLFARGSKENSKTVKAKDLWNKLCRAAWASADPGLQFHDEINRMHTCPADGPINGSNPCSEYMFLDNTACNLASLNLGAFYKPKKLGDLKSTFDTDLFIHVSTIMTCVLDISVQMASFPSREIALGAYNYRTLGLGYANLGGLLMRMGLPYDSDAGRRTAADLTSLMAAVCYRTSAVMASELGPFPRWDANRTHMLDVIKIHKDSSHGLQSELFWINALELGGKFGFRNAQGTLLAPTGTIGLLMDCDTLGIEPDFSLKKSKSLAGGGGMILHNKCIEEALVELGYDKGHIRNLIHGYIDKHGTAVGCPELKPEHVPVFACAVDPHPDNCISPLGHVKMCAAVQPFLSGAISKTINMPNLATVADVSEIYLAAWKLGLKSVSIYRDGSKLAQPLNTVKPKEEPKHNKPGDFSIEKLTVDYNRLNEISTDALRSLTITMKENMDEQRDAFNAGDEQNKLNRGVREYLPWKRGAYVQKIILGDQSLHMTVSSYPDGRPGEIFLSLSRSGPTLSAVLDCVAICMSIGLQYGVPIKEFVERLRNRKFEPSGFVEGHDQIKHAASIADFVAQDLAIEFDVEGEKEEETDWKGGETPQSAFPVPIKAVRDICPQCHEPCLIRSGSCQTCTNCAYNPGCG